MKPAGVVWMAPAKLRHIAIATSALTRIFLPPLFVACIVLWPLPLDPHLHWSRIPPTYPHPLLAYGAVDTTPLFNG